MSERLPGEVPLEGYVNGERITLDAIPVDTENGASLPIILPRRRVASSLGTGLKQEWLNAKGEYAGHQLEFDVTAGAGLGSRYLVITVRVDGDQREEIVDMGELAQAWAETIVDEGPTPKVAEQGYGDHS